MVNEQAGERWAGGEHTAGDDNSVDHGDRYVGFGEERVNGGDHTLLSFLNSGTKPSFVVSLEDEWWCVSLVAKAGLEVNATHEVLANFGETFAPANEVFADFVAALAVMVRFETGVVEEVDWAWASA